jgi:hypothetical protein
VSRLFPERVTIGFSPTELSVGDKRIACDDALHALRTLQWTRRTSVTVVLSNHFVRYALVPWNAALADPAEEEAYVRHHFTRIHGERAKSWRLRWSPEPGDAPRLASAIDAALLDALKDSFKGNAKLVSVQPCLMDAANRARHAVPASGAWLVFVERERACVALHAGGRWRSVHNAKGPWLDTLQREWHRADAAPRFALIHGADPVAAAGWTFNEMPA